MSAAAQSRAANAVGSSLTLNLMRLRTFIALFAVVLFFSFAAPNFLSAANLVLMSKHVALNAFLAIGMTFVTRPPQDCSPMVWTSASSS